MPLELRRRRFLIDRAKRWSVVLAIVVAALVATAGLLRLQVSHLQMQLADVQTTAVQLAEAKVVAGEIQAQQTLFRARQDRLQRLVRPTQWHEVIAEVADAAGDGIWFQSLNIDRPDGKSAALPGATVNDTSTAAAETERVDLTLGGYAVSNAEFAAFLARLKRCRLVTEAEPVTLRAGELLGGTLIEFSVKCRVRADAMEQARRHEGTKARRRRSASSAEGPSC